MSTPEAFAWWALLHADTHARLEADLDLTERAGEPLAWPGDATLSGELDGAGHAVAFATDGAGLFAEVAETGAVRWLALGRTAAEAQAAADAGKPAGEVASAGTLAGSVAGSSKGEIEGVVNLMPVGFSADAPAAAERSAAGIVAVNDGTVADCANLAPVSSDATAGDSAAAGIAARGAGAIATSYNAGDVRAAQNAAYIVTTLDADAGYASVVDDATCYLAPGEGAAYEGVSDAGADRPGALTASELQDAAARLNAGREGDAAAWQAGDAATNGFPAPGEPADPDAQPAGDDADSTAPDADATTPEADVAAPMLLSAEATADAPAPRATLAGLYSTWLEVGKAVQDGGIPNQKPAQGSVVLPSNSSSGTTSSAYIITTPEQLAWFVYMSNTSSTFVGQTAQLAADIDLSGLKYTGKEAEGVGENYANCLPWTPIGDGVTARAFQGRFDGAGYQIRNVRIETSGDGQGFFGAVTDSAIVERVGLPSGCLRLSSADRSDIGTLAGYVASAATVRNCYSLIDVLGDEGITYFSTAGFVGSAQGTLENCYYAGTLRADVGDAFSFATGTATRLYYDGTKSPDANAGVADAVESSVLKGAVKASELTSTYATWHSDWSNQNGGYITIARAGEPVARPSTWQNVGLELDKAENRSLLPVQETVTLGDGSQATAFVIKNAEQLAWFAYKVNTLADFGSQNAQLAADIDLSGLNYTGKEAEGVGENYANCLPWVPIGALSGSTRSVFSGIFDGAGFQIENLRVNATGQGFGFIGFGVNCRVQRVGLASGCLDVRSGDARYVGTLAGSLESSATVSNCYSRVDVVGLRPSSSEAGGLVGSTLNSASVRSCYYAGSISAQVNDAFLGYRGGPSPVQCYFDNDKTTRLASSSASALSSAQFKEAGTVSLLTSDGATWRTDWLGQNGGYPMIALKNQPAAAPASWDAVGEAMRKRVPGMPELPVEQTVLLGLDGVKGKAYVIECPEQLAWFSYTLAHTGAGAYNAKNVVLAADLDMGGLNYTGASEVGEYNANCLEWLPVGPTSSQAFKGFFDGAGHTVKNLRLVRNSAATGFFGYVAGGTIQRLGLASGSLFGQGAEAGTLAGNMTSSEVVACYSRVDVIANATGGNVAGLVGAFDSGNLVGSYYAGSIPAGLIARPMCFGSANVRVCFFDSDKASGRSDDPPAYTGLDSATFKTWGAAYELNARSADAPAPFGVDADNVNDGYPVLNIGSKTGSATSWMDVGRWAADFEPGEGHTGLGTSSSDPLKLTTPAGLAWWAYKVNSGTGFQSSYVKLELSSESMAGREYTGVYHEAENYGTCLPWEPVELFTGEFDGNGHTLVNLRIADGDDRGFFKELRGTVKNLDMEGFLSGSRIGGFAGRMQGTKAKVLNCTSYMSLQTNVEGAGGPRSDQGGIAYLLLDGATIDSCSNKSSRSYAGTNAQEPSDPGRVGGIAGVVGSGCTVRNCFNDFASAYEIMGYQAYVGGIAGDNQGTVENCYNKTPLKKTGSKGAIGDIVGFGGGTVRNCYSSSSDVYTPGDSTNADGSVKLKHLASAQMKGKGFAINLNGNKSGAGTAWTMDASGKNIVFGEMPEVDWYEIGEVVANNEGTFGSFKPTGTGADAAHAAEIATPEALAWYDYQSAEGSAPAHAKLTADIDLSGLGYAGREGAGTGTDHANCLKWDTSSSISGTFDGGGRTVKNVRGAALFSAATGTLKDLNVADSTFSSTTLVDMLLTGGTVERCSAAADVKVSADLQTGGLVKETSSNTALRDCWSRASVVSVGGPVGGLAGFVANGTTVQNCYAAPASLSGVAATSGALFARLQSASSTLVVQNCYYLQSSLPVTGLGTVTGATALTASQMTIPLLAYELNAARTGAAAPWTWDLLDNGGYPTLGVPPVVVDAGTWGGIGALQNEDELRRTVAEIAADGYGTAGAVQASAPATAALAGTGTTADPYVVRTPEALAWWANQVTTNNEGFTHTAAGASTTARFADSSVELGANIDLAGLEYTGAADAGAHHANCLEWTPIGTFTGYDTSTWDFLPGCVPFRGSFQGGAHAVKNLRLEGKADRGTGFFGLLSTYQVNRVTFASGTLDVTDVGAGMAAGTFAASTYGDTAIENNAMLVDVVGTAPANTYCAGVIGLATNDESLDASYYAGTIEDPSIQVIANSTGSGGFSASPFLYLDADNIADNNPEATRVTVDQMRSWSVAYELSRYTAENVADGKVWRKAKNTSENNGFPVLLTDEEIAAGGHMDAASSWAEVGEWWDMVDYGITGVGTTASPYQIDTPEQLAMLANKVNDGSLAAANQNVKLTRAIDLSGNKYTGKSGTGTNFDACLRWVPIGSTAHLYTGAFEGQGFGVQNMRVDQGNDGDGGLFGALGASANVANTGVDSGYSTGKGGHVGGTIGYVGGTNVKVTGCWNKAQVVSTTYNVGGVVGTTNEASGTVISKCWNTGSVTQTGGDSAGGIVGKVHSGNNTITDCFNTGAITAKTYGGGIVGGINSSPYTISNCYNAGKVTGGTSGSLVGSSGFNPVNSFYATDVGSATGVTKGTGLTSAQLKTWAVAYALGGGDGAKMPSALTTWRMAANDSDNGGFPVLVGAKATGDAAHLQNATDWSDVGEWVQLIGTKKPTAGTGAAASPFQIGTREALAWFAYMANEHGSENTPSGGVKWSAASAKLTADISMQAAYGGSDTKWVPLGNGDLVSGALTATFNGTLDGDGHTVSNLATNAASKTAGLVGTLQGTVKGVNVASSTFTSVNGSGGIAGLAGQGAVIERCSAAKDVTASSSRYSGGIAGLLFKNASAKDCWTRATVAAGNASGGFVGSLEGTSALSGCYAAAASVAGSGSKGSFTSHEGTIGTVERCYFQKASGLAAVQTGSAAKFAERTALQMSSPVMAFQLNDGRVDNVWTQVASVNDGYPTLGAVAVVLSGWAQVASVQDEGQLKRTVANIDSNGYGTAGAVQASAPAKAALVGTGTTGDPYIIRTPEALAWFAAKVNDGSLAVANQNARLGASIDLAGSDYTGKTDAGGATFTNCLAWMPIGGTKTGGGADNSTATADNPYRGSFDGQGRKVSNMRVQERPFKSGLFGYAYTGAIIANVHVASGYVHGIDRIGGVVGQTVGTVTVENCSNAATILSQSSAGGYSGIACNAGGVVGCVLGQGGLTVRGCSNAGAVTSGREAGGVLGEGNSLTTVVENSFNTGAVTSTTNAGGICGGGATSGSNNTTLTIRNCYNAGKVSGNGGSIVGPTGAAVTNSYYANDLGSVTNATRGTALTSAQLKGWGAAYALNGGDGVKALGDLKTWRKAADASENGGFPVLIRTGDSVASMQAATSWAEVGEWVSITGNAFKPATGAGTAASPYQVGSPEALAWFSYQVSNGLATANHNIKITANLDLLGSVYTGKSGTAAADSLEWNPIGAYAAGKKFAGTIDGGGHAIDHLYANQPTRQYVGLVGWADRATINSLGIGANSSLTGAGNTAAFVGACLAAKNACRITDCWNRAQVTAGPHTGAFLGDDSGSYSGSDSALIENCYNAGDATFGDASSGTVRNCYADAERYADAAVGEKRVGGAIGVTTAQMKSWGAAYQLNGGDGVKALSALTVWRKASSASDNGGYPVLVPAGATGDAAHMQPAADWGDVGLWVDAFATGKTPSGDGTAGSPFQLGSPEALAWFSCQVAGGLATANHNIKITADLDLLGSVYTGRSGTAAADSLTWSPIGRNEAGKKFSGTIDGSGRTIDHLYIDNATARYIGLVGWADAVSIDRLGIGANSAVVGASDVGAFVGACKAAANACRITNCWNRAQVTGTQYTGAFLGDDSGAFTGSNAAFIENCYNAGKAPFAYASSGTLTNCYADTDQYADAANGDKKVGMVVGVTTAQLQSWGAAYQLNGGDGSQAKNPTALTTWRQAADTTDNGGYPVLVPTGAAGDAAHMQSASDWGEVGAWVDAFATGRKPAEEPAPDSWGTGMPVYAIGSAEQLAWLAYKVNGNVAAAEQNAALTRDIDLSGYAYTGKTEGDPGTDFENCLEWVPMGVAYKTAFKGRFDGQGYAVGNLRLVCDALDDYAGFFGSTEGSVIERTALVSGALDVQKADSDSVATFVALPAGEIRDCYSLVDVVGPESTASTVGGFVGDGLSSDGSGPVRFANCYYGGNYGKFFGWWEDSDPMDAISNSYLLGSQDRPSGDPWPDGTLTGLTADQLKTWGAAYQLNEPLNTDGTQKALGDLKTWRVAADANENGGFPVLVKPGDVVAGMTPAHDWTDVGLWVDAFAPDRKPAEEAAPDGLLGIGPSQPVYSIDTAEQLAWLAYKANADNAGYGSKNVMLTASIDLFGGAYTGKAFDAAAPDLDAHLKADALPWTPLGDSPGSGGASSTFGGGFDGQGHAVSHLFTPASKYYGALIGNASGTVARVSVEASSVSGDNSAAAVVASLAGSAAAVRECSVGEDVRVSAEMAGGVVRDVTKGATVADCYSRATVTGGTYYLPSGVVNYVYNGTVKDCYFAGSAARSVVGASDGGLTESNNYYRDGSATNDAGAGSPTKLSADEMTANGGASLAGRLNGSRGGKDAPWRGDAKGANDGYPVLLLPAEIMADWAEVGAAQSEDALRLTVAEIDDKGFGTSGAVGTTAPAVAALEGTGTTDDEFVIRTPEAFAWFASKVNDGTLAAANQNARLGASIDLAGLKYTGAADAGGDTFANCLAWVPIGGVKAGGGSDNSTGTADNPYRGSFDGQGREVSNMRVQERPFKSGLFGYAYSGATIADVHVASGYVHGIDRIGGVVGQTVGAVTVEDCSNAATVLSEKSAGGFTGTACNAGGVVGCVLDQGGLTVRGCWNTGAVTSGREAGGVLGEGNSLSAVVEDSFNTGAVTSTANAGGIAGGGATGGSNNTTLAIRNCYNAGKVSGSGGSIVGPTGANVTNSYYANDLGSVTNATRGTAVTSDQLKSWGAAYQLNGGDGAKELSALTTWRKAASASDNGGYPVLVKPSATGDAAHMQPAADWGEVGAWVDAFATGKKPSNDGTASSPFQVGSPEALAWFAYKTNSDPSGFGAKHVQLSASIDLTGDSYGGTSAAPLQWVPIMANGAGHGQLTGNYSGTFDGRGNTVAHMYQHNLSAANKSSWGLVAIASGGTVKNVALEAVDIDVAPQGASSPYVTVGGVVGQLTAGAKVVGCAVKSGTIKAKSSEIMTGGIVGDIQQGGGSIENCYARANVGENVAGKYGAGLLGRPCQAGPTIKNSYFAGKASNPVCYNLPNNVTCENVFYDSTVYGSTASAKAGVTGVTTAQLQSWGAAYALNGGDGTQALGDLKTWRQAADASDNGGYPVLVKDGAAGDAAHMQPAYDWSDVGAWVDAFATDRKPDEAPAPDSWGAVAGKPVYAIATPEQLAWLAYKVSSDNAAFGSKSAVLAAPVDLAGGAYTGKTVAAGAYEDCLEWSPIGTHTYKTGVNAAFSGRFDGAGQSVDNLRIVADGTQSSGLFGWESGATLERLALSSGLVDFSGGSYCGSIVGLAQGGEVRDSYSMLALAGSGKSENGGLVGQDEGVLRRSLYFAGERRSGLADNVSALVGHCYTEARGNENCFYIDGGQAGLLEGGEIVPLTGVEKLTPAELRSWKTAWRLNGKSYVGKPASGGAVASTTWTDNPQRADGSWTHGNKGYPVFGDLELEKLVVSVDPNGVLAKPAGSDEPAKKVAGAITTPILVAHPLSGPVELLESPAAPAGVTLSAASDVDAGFSTWGTTSANAKVALVAGATSLTASTYAGTVLSPTGLASVEVHAAAAYDAADARTAKLVVMDAAGGYEIEVTLKAVDSKTLDVTAPVESGASFELAPDGKLHEGVMAKEASVFKVNNAVPVAGYVSAVSPLAEGSEVAYSDGSKAEVSAVLSPTASKLAASNGPITDAGKVRLFAGKTDGAGADAGLAPLALSLYYDPSKGTVPLAFAVPGNGQVAWKWGMDYTGTYLEPDGVFGFSMGYAFGLPASDVTSAKLEEKA